MLKQDRVKNIAIGYSYFYPYDNKEQIRAEIKRGLDPLYKHFKTIYAIDDCHCNWGYCIEGCCVCKKEKNYWE